MPQGKNSKVVTFTISKQINYSSDSKQLTSFGLSGLPQGRSYPNRVTVTRYIYQTTTSEATGICYEQCKFDGQRTGSLVESYYVAGVLNL